MPSGKSLDELRKSGIPVDSSPYNLVDGLESREDLDEVIGTLGCFRDVNGHAPKLTCYFVLGNPDFDRIRACDFAEYHWEPFSKSYDKYSGGGLAEVWKSAFESQLVFPQFHAREHVNVCLWMSDLRSGRSDTRVCFDKGFFGQIRSKVRPRFYSATYWAQSPQELDLIKNNFLHGLKLFETNFGYASTTFAACNYVLPREMEECSAHAGIRGIQSQRGYFAPDNCGRLPLQRYRYTGYQNQFGQWFTIRNVSLEPFIRCGKDWCREALREVSLAFAMGRPAVVSTHRANFVSRVSRSNRAHSLLCLADFLKAVIRNWPDVEFVNSAELLELMSGLKCVE